MEILAEKKNKKDKFEVICRKLFLFLIIKYQFEIRLERDWYGTKLIYYKSKIEIHISFVPRDGGIFLDLKMPSFAKKTTGKSYDIKDVIGVRKPDCRFVKYNLDELLHNETLVKKVLLNYRKALKDHCLDFLEKGFIEMPKVDALQRKRQAIFDRDLE